MKTLFTLLAVLISIGANAQTQVKNVDAVAFKKYMEDKKSVLIDLRTNEEIKSKGIIPGAIQIDYLAKGAEDTIAKLDKTKTYLIYCAGGGRSGECAGLMQKLGFKEVINLEKGFGDWKNKGFEIDKK